MHGTDTIDAGNLNTISVTQHIKNCDYSEMIDLEELLPLEVGKVKWNGL